MATSNEKGGTATPSRHRGAALLACLGWTLTLMALLAAVSAGQEVALEGVSDRTRALARIALAVVAEGAVLAAIALWARRSGAPLLERPLREPGRVRGWLLGLAIWLLWCLPLLLSPPEGSPVLEASSFNLLGSILAGPGAGALEETLFRGVFFALLARGGWGTAGQLLTSSLLFGGAHAGWGLGGGGGAALLFPVAGTTVLGLLFGLVYLAAGRRLLPAVVIHAALNVVIEPWLVLASVQGTLVLPG